MSEINQSTFTFQDQQLGGTTVTVVDAFWSNVPSHGGEIFGAGYTYVQNGVQFNGPMSGVANGQSVSGFMGMPTGMSSYGNGQTFNGPAN